MSRFLTRTSAAAYRCSPTLVSIPTPTLARPSSVVASRSLHVSCPIHAPGSGSTVPPPPKKMYHLPQIHAVPSQYPDFRTVLWTGESSQLVIMTVPVGGDIGEEVHEVDQHLFFTSGVARAEVGGETKEVKAGDLVVVPQGTKHNCESELLARLEVRMARRYRYEGWQGWQGWQRRQRWQRRPDRKRHGHN